MAVTAIPGELAGFIWAIGQEMERPITDCVELLHLLGWGAGRLVMVLLESALGRRFFRRPR